MTARKGFRTAGTLAAPALLLVCLGGAGAEEATKLNAKQILKKCDDFHFFAKDTVYKIDVTLIDKDGKKSYMKLENYQKGAKKRLLRFTEPKDIAGFSILTIDENTMYVYEPSLGKVRRIASHAKKQSMLGNDFTLDEAGTFRLGSDYEPKLIGEDETSWTLFLTQKAGKDKAWPIQKVTVDKKKFFAAKIEYCDDKEKKHKTETRTKVKKLGGKWVTSNMKMVDHDKKHTTIYEMTELKFDANLPDELFTKRNLVRDED
jgi:outer membrane lipoprotein-sorting protein